MNTSPTGRVEGSGSTWLPNWWTSHPLHASLPALRRIGAAGVPTRPLGLLAPFRRRLATVVAAARLAAVRRRHTAATRLAALGRPRGRATFPNKAGFPSPGAAQG